VELKKNSYENFAHSLEEYHDIFQYLELHAEILCFLLELQYEVEPEYQQVKIAQVEYPARFEAEPKEEKV